MKVETGSERLSNSLEVMMLVIVGDGHKSNFDGLKRLAPRCDVPLSLSCLLSLRPLKGSLLGAASHSSGHREVPPGG